MYLLCLLSVVMCETVIGAVRRMIMGIVVVMKPMTDLQRKTVDIRGTTMWSLRPVLMSCPLLVTLVMLLYNCWLSHVSTTLLFCHVFCMLMSVNDFC